MKTAKNIRHLEVDPDLDPLRERSRLQGDARFSEGAAGNHRNRRRCLTRATSSSPTLGRVRSRRIALPSMLRQDGFSVWRDDELPAHRAYSDVIEERLKSAKAVVVLWSAESAKSHWVRAEADTAREAGTLVQATLDSALPPMPFNQIQCADLNGWSGDTASPDGASSRAASPRSSAERTRKPARQHPPGRARRRCAPPSACFRSST